MFERLSVRQQRYLDPDAPLDLGALVEAMVFYGSTEVVVNPAVLKQLSIAWTPEGLIELLEGHHVRFLYQQNFTGISTANTGTNRERHHPVVFTVSRANKMLGPEHFVGETFENVIGRRGRAKRLANRFCKLVETTQIDESITERAKLDLADSDFVRASAIEILKGFVPELTFPPSFSFKVQEVDDGFRVITNIDFAVVNSLYHKRISAAHSSLSPAYILAHLLTAREMIESAASADADIAADPIHAAIATHIIRSAVQRTASNANRLIEFQDFIFDSGHAIREAVNNGERSIKDIIQLVNNAEKFKTWLAGRELDANLTKEYYRAVTASTWVEKLPTKTMRWAIFTGLGLAADAMGAGGLGTAAGVGISATDTFFLDKLFKGWKPNQFIEGPLAQFVKPRSND